MMNTSTLQRRLENSIIRKVKGLSLHPKEESQKNGRQAVQREGLAAIDSTME